MKYHIQHNSNFPAYLQLYHQLRQDIIDGIYNYGTKLPSKRLLAEEVGTSVITVEHTYAILCDEGYIESRQRSGYYVIYRKNDFMSLPSNHCPDNFSRSSGSLEYSNSDKQITPVPNTAGVFSSAILSKTMRRVLNDYGDRILVKSPNRGCPELRKAISSYLARSNGLKADPDQIIVGAGSEYLYTMIIQLLGKDQIYGLENPSYEKIRRVYEAFGAPYRMLDMDNNGIKSTELSDTDATVLHVTPYNSYPSGITTSVSKRHEYLRWAEERGGYIIEDNYDSELTVSTKNEDTVFSLSEQGKVIYLNTFSQTIAPSVRVGYMVLPRAMLKLYEQYLDFYSCTVPVFEQYVLADLIESGDFERHINRVRRQRRKASRRISSETGLI